jgi:hypothetical protein
MKRGVRHPDDDRSTRRVDAAQLQSLAQRVTGQPILLVCGTPVDGVPAVHLRPTTPIERLKRDTVIEPMPYGSAVGRATVMFDPRSLELDRGVVMAVAGGETKAR